MDKIKQWAHKEFDLVIGITSIGETKEEHQKRAEKLIDSIIDKAIADYQTNYEQKHLVSAVESERDRIVGIIEKMRKREHGDTVIPESHGLIIETLNDKRLFNRTLKDIISLITNKSDGNK